MNIQIFGQSKCFDTKKAERWFKERRIRFQSIDPRLLKTPIVRNGRQATVGYCPEVWQGWA